MSAAARNSATVALTEKTSMHAIVDSHVHLWNPHKLRYSWLDGLPQLNPPFLPDDFAAASAGVNVEKMIFVECGREESQALDEVKWVSELAKTEPRLRGIVAHASLEKGESGRKDLEALTAFPLVKGVRRLLQGESDLEFCLRPGFIAGVQQLAQFDFTFDLCIRHQQLPSATELVRRVPEVQFVLDHFGKPPVKAGQLEPWATQLKKLAQLPNIVCKISGLTTEANWQNWRTEDLQPYFDVVFGAFGHDRVLFGGDWPVSRLATSYQRWVETVSQLSTSFTVANRKNLFQNNAEKIYRI
jgi:L-fuconolactonase